MSKSAFSKFFGNTRIPQIMMVVGLFFLLIGYTVGSEVMIASGWIVIIFGAGWFLILKRTRI